MDAILDCIFIFEDHREFETSLTSDTSGLLQSADSYFAADPHSYKALRCLEEAEKIIRENTFDEKENFAKSAVKLSRKIWDKGLHFRKDCIEIDFSLERKRLMTLSSEILTHLSKNYRDGTVSSQLAYTKECLGSFYEAIGLLEMCISWKKKSRYETFKAAVLLLAVDNKNVKIINYLEECLRKPPTKKGLGRVHVLALLIIAFDSGDFDNDEFDIDLSYLGAELHKIFSNMKSALMRRDGKLVTLELDIWEFLGAEATKKCEYVLATHYLKKALEIEPTKAKLHYMLAEINYLLNKHDLAEASAMEGFAIQPKFRPIVLSLILRSFGRWVSILDDDGCMQVLDFCLDEWTRLKFLHQAGLGLHVDATTERRKLMSTCSNVLVTLAAKKRDISMLFDISRSKECLGHLSTASVILDVYLGKISDENDDHLQIARFKKSALALLLSGTEDKGGVGEAILFFEKVCDSPPFSFHKTHAIAALLIGYEKEKDLHGALIEETKAQLSDEFEKLKKNLSFDHQKHIPRLHVWDLLGLDCLNRCEYALACLYLQQGFDYGELSPQFGTYLAEVYLLFDDTKKSTEILESRLLTQSAKSSSRFQLKSVVSVAKTPQLSPTRKTVIMDILRSEPSKEDSGTDDEDIAPLAFTPSAAMHALNQTSHDISESFNLDTHDLGIDESDSISDHAPNDAIRTRHAFPFLQSYSLSIISKDDAESVEPDLQTSKFASDEAIDPASSTHYIAGGEEVEVITENITSTIANQANSFSLPCDKESVDSVIADVSNKCSIAEACAADCDTTASELCEGMVDELIKSILAIAVDSVVSTTLAASVVAEEVDAKQPIRMHPNSHGCEIKAADSKSEVIETDSKNRVQPMVAEAFVDTTASELCEGMVDELIKSVLAIAVDSVVSTTLAASVVAEEVIIERPILENYDPVINNPRYVKINDDHLSLQPVNIVHSQHAYECKFDYPISSIKSMASTEDCNDSHLFVPVSDLLSRLLEGESDRFYFFETSQFTDDESSVVSNYVDVFIEASKMEDDIPSMPLSPTDFASSPDSTINHKLESPTSDSPADLRTEEEVIAFNVENSCEPSCDSRVPSVVRLVDVDAIRSAFSSADQQRLRSNYVLTVGMKYQIRRNETAGLLSVSDCYVFEKNADGSCQIIYENGRIETNVDASRLIAPSSDQKEPSQKPRIVKKLRERCYDCRGGVLHSETKRPTDGPLSSLMSRLIEKYQSVCAGFRKDASVLVFGHDGQWRHGRIVAEHSDHTFDIIYENGEGSLVRYVNANNIKLAKNTSTLPPHPLVAQLTTDVS